MIKEQLVLFLLIVIALMPVLHAQNLEEDLMKIAKRYEGLDQNIYLKMTYSAYMDTIVGQSSEVSKGESLMLSDSVQYQKMGNNEILYRTGITCIVDHLTKTIMVTRTMSEGGLLNKKAQIDTALIRLFEVTNFEKRKNKSTYKLKSKYKDNYTMSLTFNSSTYQLLQMTTKYPTEVEDENGNTGHPILMVDFKQQNDIPQEMLEKTKVGYYIDLSNRAAIKPTNRYRGYKVQSLLE